MFSWFRKAREKRESGHGGADEHGTASAGRGSGSDGHGAAPAGRGSGAGEPAANAASRVIDDADRDAASAGRRDGSVATAPEKNGAPSAAEPKKAKAVDDPYALPDPPEELPRHLGGPIADMSEVAATYDTPEPVRLFLVFDGTVQGVGFRWTTQSLARKVGVTGWVRNMDDGTVQAEMQGAGHDICRVLCAMRGQFIDAWSNYEVLRRMKFHFVITRCERLNPREGETDFNVRF